MIKFRDIKKSYRSLSQEITALGGVSAEIQKGSVVAIGGAYGAGKSTLLNILTCRDNTYLGDVYFKNALLPKHGFHHGQCVGGKIGYVERLGLKETCQVVEDVILERMAAEPIADWEKQQRLIDLLESVALRHKALDPIYSLNEAEKVKLAIVRELSTNPEVVAADELTTELTSKDTFEVIHTLLMLAEQQELTLILATADARLAHYCDHMIQLDNGELMAERNF